MPPPEVAVLLPDYTPPEVTTYVPATTNSAETTSVIIVPLKV